MSPTPNDWAERYEQAYREQGLPHASWIGCEALDDLREDPAGQQQFSDLVDAAMELVPKPPQDWSKTPGANGSEVKQGTAKNF